MGRPRRSFELLELSGSLAHNRKRHRDRLKEPQSNGPLGPPPDYFDAFHLSVWDELVDATPPGLLRLSDSTYVELTVRLLCKLRVWQVHSPRMLRFFECKMRDRGVSTDDIAELRSAFALIFGCTTQELRILADCLRKLGMTPADHIYVI